MCQSDWAHDCLAYSRQPTPFICMYSVCVAWAASQCGAYMHVHISLQPVAHCSEWVTLFDNCHKWKNHFCELRDGRSRKRTSSYVFQWINNLLRISVSNAIPYFGKHHLTHVHRATLCVCFKCVCAQRYGGLHHGVIHYHLWKVVRTLLLTCKSTEKRILRQGNLKKHVDIQHVGTYWLAGRDLAYLNYFQWLSVCGLQSCVLWFLWH